MQSICIEFEEEIRKVLSRDADNMLRVRKEKKS